MLVHSNFSRNLTNPNSPGLTPRSDPIYTSIPPASNLPPAPIDPSSAFKSDPISRHCTNFSLSLQVVPYLFGYHLSAFPFVHTTRVTSTLCRSVNVIRLSDPVCIVPGTCATFGPTVVANPDDVAAIDHPAGDIPLSLNPHILPIPAATISPRPPLLKPLVHRCGNLKMTT